MRLLGLGFVLVASLAQGQTLELPDTPQLPVEISREHRAAVHLPASVLPERVDEILTHWVERHVHIHYAFAIEGDPQNVRTRLRSELTQAGWPTYSDLPSHFVGSNGERLIGQSRFDNPYPRPIGGPVRHRRGDSLIQLAVYEDGIALELFTPRTSSLSDTIRRLPWSSAVSQLLPIAASHATQLHQTVVQFLDLEAIGTDASPEALAAIERWGRNSRFRRSDMREFLEDGVERFQPEDVFEGHVDGHHIIVGINRSTRSFRLFDRQRE